MASMQRQQSPWAKQCICGCGTIIPFFSTDSKERYYSRGHYWSVHPITDEMKAKMSATRRRNGVKPNSGQFQKGHPSQNKGKIGLYAGEANPNYRTGKYCKPRFCVDCGGRITHQSKTGRCYDCSAKHQRSAPELNPNWKGGVSRHPYPFDFNDSVKAAIRDRDGHECQLCHAQETDLPRGLDVHHINYDKNDLDPLNLIALCGPCHLKTNGKRNYWEEELMNLMTFRFIGDHQENAFMKVG